MKTSEGLKETNEYRIPTGKRVTISDALTNEIKDMFDQDKDNFERVKTNRFQLFLLSSGIRNKYLDKKTKTYPEEFTKWYKSSGMEKLFGSVPNFTKYCGCGDVVNYVGTQTSDPEKYLKKLPHSVGSLYEISMILKMGERLFKTCLHYTPKRKSVDELENEWRTPKPSLINPKVSELKVRSWRRKWETPPPPRQKRTDKRSLPFVTITCSGELYDFDKKTGDKVGVLDLDQVDEFYRKLANFFETECPSDLQFRLQDHLDDLTEGYYKRKERVDPAIKIKEMTSKKQQKYV